MFNDKMDIDDMILDLSTRGSNHFGGNDERQYVCVSIASHKDYKDIWQVWMTHYKYDIIVPGILDRSLMEGNTLRQALIFLDRWYDNVIYVQNEMTEQDRSDIVESIGYGD